MIKIRETSKESSQIKICQVKDDPQEVFFVMDVIPKPRRYWMRVFWPKEGKGYVAVVSLLEGILERFPNDTLVTLVDVEIIIHPKGDLE